MKKYIALILVMMCIFSLVSCNKTDNSRNSLDQIEQEKEYSMKAIVLEVYDTYMLVKPVDGSAEINSADKIEVPFKDNTSWPIPQVGDTVNVIYNGEILETYPARLSKVYRVEIVESATEDSVADLGITLTAKDISATGLTIVCTQSGGNPSGELNTGSFYVIEKYVDNEWIEVEFAPQEYDVAWTAEAWLIPMNDTVDWNVNWEWLYGELPAGEYRIGKEVMDFRGPGEYDEAMCYAEFEIN